MEKEIIATFRAATAKPDYLTMEHLSAGFGGWGAFNMGVWAASNVIAKEIKKGRYLKLEVNNDPFTDVDEIAKKSVDKLMSCGADPANAALATAALLYFAGVNAQCGMPCPNRKLGAVARMAAGIPSGRVSSIPTEKQNNKISGFAATLAIYKALDEENLAPFDSDFLPLGAGGPITGHSAVGEDHLFPKLGKKLATIGAKAMMKAYCSAGMKPNLWLSALFGASAALEIIHPDAYVGEEFGEFLSMRTPETTAQAAVEEVGLPKKLHLRGTGQELDTASLIGDLAIILKDVGTPTVVGMIMFCEICSVIAEGAGIGVGRAGGPVIVPLHHWVTAPVLALNQMGQGKNDSEIKKIIRVYIDQYFQKESAAVANNLLARKAEQAETGPLTDIILCATEPVMSKAIFSRAKTAYDKLKSGMSLSDLVKETQTCFIDSNAKSVAVMMSKKLGKKIEYIKFPRVEPGSGRRKNEFAHRHFAFDARIDIEIKIDGKVHFLENALAKAMPDALMKKDREKLDAFSAAAPAIVDMMCLGACSMDVTVCACMAAAMGMDPEEAVKKAVEAGDVFVAIPAPSGLFKAVQLAADIAGEMDI
ncbi:hypothetical protein MNBD_NITROSPINAE04-300 [hydrothermal vent metagenome]|uniref:Uncharacterized protein n=1 Tax=hydrothermal vent metagenome TaxID=652676 RepID=A0A3B1CW06_9ZZZZ